MKLFSKKKEEAKSELPPLKFPEFPQGGSKVPKYESGISSEEASSIKEAVAPKLEIPIRKPMTRKPILPPSAPSYQKPMPTAPVPGEIQKRGQALFVKMERYREAVEKMQHIKDKITEAERVLSHLDEIKRKEDEELTKWHQDLEIIKTKLLAVDRNLFGGT